PDELAACYARRRIGARRHAHARRVAGIVDRRDVVGVDGRGGHARVAGRRAGREDLLHEDAVAVDVVALEPRPAAVGRGVPAEIDLAAAGRGRAERRRHGWGDRVAQRGGRRGRRPRRGRRRRGARRRRQRGGRRRGRERGGVGGGLRRGRRGRGDGDGEG